MHSRSGGAQVNGMPHPGGPWQTSERGQSRFVRQVRAPADVLDVLEALDVLDALEALDVLATPASAIGRLSTASWLRPRAGGPAPSVSMRLVVAT
jgi:hypothetical protein